GDFNRHIRSSSRGYEDVHGGFGFRDRNDGGVSFLNFARAFGLMVANLSFPKEEEHLVSFRSSVAKTPFCSLGRVIELFVKTGMETICGIRLPAALGSWLERCWVSREADMVGIEGIGSGMEKHKGRYSSALGQKRKITSDLSACTWKPKTTMVSATVWIPDIDCKGSELPTIDPMSLSLLGYLRLSKHFLHSNNQCTVNYEKMDADTNNRTPYVVIAGETLYSIEEVRKTKFILEIARGIPPHCCVPLIARLIGDIENACYYGLTFLYPNITWRPQPSVPVLELLEKHMFNACEALSEILGDNSHLLDKWYSKGYMFPSYLDAKLFGAAIVIQKCFSKLSLVYGNEKGDRLLLTIPVKVNFVSWNVRGLNDPGKRLKINNMMYKWRVDAYCFQEYKLKGNIEEIIKDLWANRRIKYVQLETELLEGGIIMPWDSSV
ncbi:hypothetical protein H5410_057626, partial [Solanum commersonii]